MMKFFRKYNKTLLVVSMVFLMIVFMGGNALYDLASPDVDRLIATSKLGKITLKQQASARSTTDILGGMGLPWQYPAMGARKPIEIMDWILLEREAKRLGMKVRMAAIQSSLGDNKNLNLLATRIGVPPALIMQAMAQYQTIQMLASQIGNAAIPSEAEVMVSASQSLAKVRFNAVMLPAAAFVSEDASFTEQQQQTHFDKYQNREAGTGLAFGYYVPPAIRVQ